MTIDELIAQARELAAKAAPGPWRIEPRDVKFYADGRGTHARSPEEFDLTLASQDDFLGAEVVGPPEPGRGTFTVPDAAFIAFARNNLERLCAEIEALWKVADAAEVAVYCMPGIQEQSDLKGALAALPPRKETT